MKSNKQIKYLQYINTVSLRSELLLIYRIELSKNIYIYRETDMPKNRNKNKKINRFVSRDGLGKLCGINKYLY